jgi:hypothetical protein
MAAVAAIAAIATSSKTPETPAQRDRLTWMQLNIQGGLIRKTDAIAATLREHDVSLAILTETRCETGYFHESPHRETQFIKGYHAICNGMSRDDLKGLYRQQELGRYSPNTKNTHHLKSKPSTATGLHRRKEALSC